MMAVNSGGGGGQRQPAPGGPRQPSGKRANHVLLAAGWMMTAVVSFSLSAIAAREASKGVSTISLIFWRSLMAIGMLAVVMVVLRQPFAQLLTPRPWLHWMRNALHFTAQFSWLYALTLIPMAQLFAIEFTAPLWVALLAPFVLNERLTGARVAAAVLGFIGVLVVVRPGHAELTPGVIFALIAAFGFASSMICTKLLTRTDSILVVLVYMATLQMLMALPPALFELQHLTLVTWGWIAAVAFLGLTSHYALTRAFVLADAMLVAPMDFVRLPLIAVIGYLLYNEPLDPWVLAGGSVVVAGNIVNIWGERRRR